MTEFAFFYCQHQTERMAQFLREWDGSKGIRIRKVALPCSGKMEVAFLLKALENGAAGAAVFGCPEGECHYLVGSTRARNRTRYGRKILREIGVQEDRIQRFSFERPPRNVDLGDLHRWVETLRSRAELKK